MSSSGSESILGKNVDTLYLTHIGVNELFLPINQFCSWGQMEQGVVHEVNPEVLNVDVKSTRCEG